MVGDDDRTISPSSVNTSRSTPCVLGCCGPMLTVMVSVRSPDSWSFSTGTMASATAGQPIAFDVGRKLFLRHLQGLSQVRGAANLHRRILPEREALPVFGHQETPRIGMTVEDDAEQVPDLAFEPVGRRPDAAD